MAEKRVAALIKLQVAAGSATPAPPVGPALGPHGVNSNDFCKQFNERTQNVEKGLTIPVVISVYADRSFSFVTKTPPAAVLIKKTCSIDKGSSEPNKSKVAKISRKQLEEIADMKKTDLNARSLEAGVSIIAGTARSMGVEVEGWK